MTRVRLIRLALVGASVGIGVSAATAHAAYPNIAAVPPTLGYISGFLMAFGLFALADNQPA